MGRIYYIVSAVAIVIITSIGCSSTARNKTKDGSKEEQKVATYEINKEKEVHRTTFFEEYKEWLPQFMDEKHFSVWLDNTDKESIVLLYGLVEAVGDEYDGDDGFGYMVDYLHVAF